MCALLAISDEALAGEVQQYRLVFLARVVEIEGFALRQIQPARDGSRFAAAAVVAPPEDAQHNAAGEQGARGKDDEP